MILITPGIVCCLFSVLVAVWWNCLAVGNEAGAAVNKYMSMSIDQLMNIKITSVSKSEESLSDAAAAVYVITQEDIRRSGATSIPEALRIAPGVQVAQIDSNKWAITARGFNGKYANKLLVLMDGRSVYTPLYSGVYWDVQDTMIEDIDRIEVIRGPGATLWGANAVNGVINIITKSAEDSQGVLAAGGAGNQERGFGQARFGGKIGNLAYRVYGKGFYRASYPFGQMAQAETLGMLKVGHDGADQWAQGRGGFRTDWQVDSDNHLTIQGDIYSGYSGGTLNYLQNESVGMFNDKADLNGGNVIARWKHGFSQGTELAVQLYYDRIEQNKFEYHVRRNTYDLDVQQSLKLPWSQKLMLGFGYRYSSDSINFPPSFQLDPNDKILHWISGFIQDEIELLPGTLRLILGSKFESNDYTGFELQPSARIIWKPTSKQAVWAAVSRAVRTPCRGDENLFVEGVDRRSVTNIDFGPVTLPVPTRFRAYMIGNNDFEAETLLAYEVGYRLMPSDRFSLDVAAFLNDYNRLRTLNFKSTSRQIVMDDPLSPQLDIVNYYQFDNHQSGHTYGVEMAATLKLRQWWTVYSTYSWLNYNLGYDSGTENILASPAEWSPRQQFSLRSYMDLPYNLELDSALYYSDGLDGYNVPSYTRLDMRVGWKPVEWADVSLMLENLLDNQHPEFGGYDEGIVPTEVPRSFYGKVTFRF